MCRDASRSNASNKPYAALEIRKRVMVGKAMSRESGLRLSRDSKYPCLIMNSCFNVDA
jgi:hypothetical protein